VLEVVFDVVSTSAPGKLDLYYGQDPRRKYITLVARGETLESGRYYKYFTPQQVQFPTWSPIPPLCQGQCGACPAVHDDPQFGFSSTDMTLAGEGCSEPVDAKIRLVSVNIISRGCGCTTKSDCSSAPSRSECRAPDSGVGACGWPTSFPLGMCGTENNCDTSVPIGTSCTVEVQSTTCSGTWQCQNGTPVCAVKSCAP
jgi:hypothetical protein